MKRQAFIGDIHGELEHLEILYKMLENYSLDAIEHCGDLVDRGPDPAGVIQFCREKKMGGVMGNHDSVIIQYPRKNGSLPLNPDKLRSYNEITKDPANMEYLKALPYHKIHDGTLLHTHAGMSPFQSLDDQRMNDFPNLMFCTASLIHIDHPYKTKWMGETKEGVKEETLREQGWVAWYEPYNLPYDVVVGHRSLQNTGGKAERITPCGGKSIYFVDTGAWFHKNLTALIYPDLVFVSSKLGEYRLD